MNGKSGIRILRKRIAVLVAVSVTAAAACISVERAEVSGVSMEPALSDGDVVLVDKVSWRLTGLRRNDVIVFRYRYRPERYYIKRIVGLPGETVEIRDGRLRIDGEEPDGDFGNSLIENAGRAAEPVCLAEGTYFVLGDNRNDSADSRDYDIGDIRSEDIIGRVFLRFRDGKLCPEKNFWRKPGGGPPAR